MRRASGLAAKCRATCAGSGPRTWPAYLASVVTLVACSSLPQQHAVDKPIADDGRFATHVLSGSCQVTPSADTAQTIQGPAFTVPSGATGVALLWLPAMTDRQCRLQRTSGSAAIAGGLAAALNAGQVVPPGGTYNCPIDYGAAVLLTFTGVRVPPVLVTLMGCRFTSQDHAGLRRTGPDVDRLLLDLSPSSGTWRQMLKP